MIQMLIKNNLQNLQQILDMLMLHKEELNYENIKIQQRSYK